MRREEAKGKFVEKEREGERKREQGHGYIHKIRKPLE